MLIMALLGVPPKIVIMKENWLVALKYKKKLSNIISIHCTKGLKGKSYHQEANSNCLKICGRHKILFYISTYPISFFNELYSKKLMICSLKGINK